MRQLFSFFILILSCSLSFSSCNFFNPEVDGTEIQSVTRSKTLYGAGSPLELPARIDLGPNGGSVWLNLNLSPKDRYGDIWLLTRNHQSVMELVVNDAVLQTAGQLSPGLFIPVGKYLVFRIPGSMLNPNNQVSVHIRVYSDSPEVKLSRFYVMSKEGAQYYEQVVNLLNNNIYRYFAFLCFFIFVYFIVQFFQMTEDKSSLFFALFNLFIAAYFFGIGQSWIGLPFLFFLTFFKACLFLAIPCLLLFCMAFTGYKLMPAQIAVTVAGLLLFGYVVLMSSNSMDANLRFRHALVGGMVMMCAAYAFILVNFFQGQKELKPLALGGFLAFITGAVDALSMLVGFETLFWLQGFGIFVFLLSVFMALAGRTSRMHAELQGYARGIEAEVARRTSQLNASNQALSMASNAKSEFLAHMSHEIRTPLNCIMGFAQILEQRSVGEIDRYYSGLILRESDHLMQLISQILDLSRIEQGKLILDNRPFDLREAFSSLIEGFSQSAGRKGLTLDFVVKGTLPQHVNGDMLRFQQILINLLGNAIKFTEKGKVVIEARVSPSSDAQGILLEVSVVDTGIGIASEKLDTIFNRFEQADSSITRKFGGTGLGITIARDLVHLMGGEIHVASTAGAGTRVNYAIRLQLANPDELIIPPSPHEARGTWIFPPDFFVLVVDDYFANIEVVRVFLERKSIGMIEARSGAEAIEKFQKMGKQIDLILMDIHMPDMDGFETTKQIRQLPHGAELPVVAITADAFEETARKCQQTGIVAVLTKPLRYEELMETLFRFSPQRNPGYTPNIAASKPPGKLDAAHPVIDYKHLDETYFGDQEVIKQLLGLFADSGARLLEELRAAMHTQHLETIHLKAHTIKGGALNVGARKLSLSASRLELKAKKKELETIEPLFQALESDWHDFVSEWRKTSP